MISTSGLKVIRPAEAPLGSLLAMSAVPAQPTMLGIAAAAGEKRQRVVLLFPQGKEPYAATRNDYCLLLTEKPEYRWRGKVEDTANSRHMALTDGHLVVKSSSLLLCALTSLGHEAFWDCGSGLQVLEDLDGDQFVIPEWSVGVTLDGSFHSFLDWKRPAPGQA